MIQKHLAGQHNQQKHGHRVYLVMSIAKKIPVNKILGAAHVWTSSSSKPYISFTYGNAITLNVDEDRGNELVLSFGDGSNPKCLAAIDFAQQFAKEMGQKEIRWVLSEPRHLDVAAQLNAEIDLKSVQNALDQAVGGFEDEITEDKVMADFRRDAAQTLADKTGRNKREFAPLIERLIMEDGKYKTDRRPINSLNTYSIYKLQKILAIKDGFVFDAFSPAK